MTIEHFLMQVVLKLKYLDATTANLFIYYFKISLFSFIKFLFFDLFLALNTFSYAEMERVYVK
jgi:hypothetical protein